MRFTAYSLPALHCSPIAVPHGIKRNATAITTNASQQQLQHQLATISNNEPQWFPIMVYGNVTAQQP